MRLRGFGVVCAVDGTVGGSLALVQDGKEVFVKFLRQLCMVPTFQGCQKSGVFRGVVTF